jgi:hypothetical protein
LESFLISGEENVRSFCHDKGVFVLEGEAPERVRRGGTQVRAAQEQRECVERIVQGRVAEDVVRVLAARAEKLKPIQIHLVRIRNGLQSWIGSSAYSCKVKIAI